MQVEKKKTCNAFDINRAPSFSKWGGGFKKPNDSCFSAAVRSDDAKKDGKWKNNITCPCCAAAFLVLNRQAKKRKQPDVSPAHGQEGAPSAEQHSVAPSLRQNHEQQLQQVILSPPPSIARCRRQCHRGPSCLSS
jgi:hypothetical protein